MSVFKILAINMAHLDEAIQKLNRKAKKLKCQEIVTKVLGYSPAIVDKDGFRKQRAFYEVEVTGESPVIPGSFPSMVTRYAKRQSNIAGCLFLFCHDSMINL